MDLNPYQPPLVAAPTLADELCAGERPAPRPVGIWLLVGLHLLAGLLFVTMSGFLLWEMSTKGDSRLGQLSGLLAGICVAMAALALGSATGLWLGQRWGWWLAAFYYVWASLGVVADTLLAFSRLEHVDAESIAYILPGKLIQLVIHLLILGYLFKGTVRAFFRLQSLSTPKALRLLSFAAIVVLTATYAAISMMQTNQP